MSERLPDDRAIVTTYVAVDPETAFAVFTEEIDVWWRRGPIFRVSGRLPGRLRMEPFVGGRLYEEIETSGGARDVVSGEVTVWEPPHRLEFLWRAINFAPDEKTTVVVTFDPSGAGTRVRLVHSGWASLRDDHPARHGQVGAAFVRRLGLWWGQLFDAYRDRLTSGSS